MYLFDVRSTQQELLAPIFLNEATWAGLKCRIYLDRLNLSYLIPDHMVEEICPLSIRLKPHGGGLVLKAMKTPSTIGDISYKDENPHWEQRQKA